MGATHIVVTLETEESGIKLIGLLESEAGLLWAVVGFCTLALGRIGKCGLESSPGTACQAVCPSLGLHQPGGKGPSAIHLPGWSAFL